ncbi:MAG: GFA family protein [Gammaproteobacteria bacterium]|nr:GFA family protein [Gammaproteobacteria bacterium]
MNHLGHCLCGTVRWRHAGTFERMTHCHCGLCRKAHGSAYGTYVIGARRDFQWEAGEEAITRRESSAGFTRSFCQHCGSVLPNPHFDDIVAAPAAGFEGDLGIRPSAHIFARWKAPWFPITDALPQHDNYPGEAAPAVTCAAPTPSQDGLLRGSCLCGAVGFEVSEAFKVVQHCHCTRCQRGRAAAFATNGFTSLAGVHFTRGEDNLRVYRHLEARYFAQVFCVICGSKLPRHCPERQIAIVPFGTLDDDPGRMAERHVFTASKASWDEITDQLPCYAAMPT